MHLIETLYLKRPPFEYGIDCPQLLRFDPEGVSVPQRQGLRLLYSPPLKFQIGCSAWSCDLV
jgi:hypothetical protein